MAKKTRSNRRRQNELAWIRTSGNGLRSLRNSQRGKNPSQVAIRRYVRSGGRHAMVERVAAQRRELEELLEGMEADWKATIASEEYFQSIDIAYGRMFGIAADDKLVASDPVKLHGEHWVELYADWCCEVALEKHSSYDPYDDWYPILNEFRYDQSDGAPSGHIAFAAAL